MGVLGLWKLLDATGKPVPLETLEGKVLAVGMQFYLKLISYLEQISFEHFAKKIYYPFRCFNMDSSSYTRLSRPKRQYAAQCPSNRFI